MGKSSTELAIHPAPVEMQAYLTKLTKVCGYTDPVQIALIAGDDMPARVGVTDDPHGFLHLQPDKVPLIVLRDDIPANLWQSVVAHEFLHLLRWDADALALERLTQAEGKVYMQLVERTMKPLTIILIAAGVMNVEWVEGE